MRQLELLELELEDFKGVSDFSLTPKGESVKIEGENDTGKTTLFDSFLWLLFDEDSRGQSQFDVLPVDEAGEPGEETAATVKGKFRIDDEEFELKKTYKEVWRTERGSNEEKLKGHTYDYEIDGVPKKKSEYEEFLEDKFDLQKLRMLVDARKFNTLHWQDRREILMNMVEGVSIGEIVEDNPELEDLNLNSRTPDEYRKYLKKEKKAIDEKLDEIPTRIDEIQKGRPELEDEPDNPKELVRFLEDEKKTLIEQKEKIEDEIQDLRATGKEKELRKKRDEVEDQLAEFREEWGREHEEKIGEVKEEREELIEKYRQVEEQFKSDKTDLELLGNKEERLESEVGNLRERWHTIKEDLPEDLHSEDVEECPKCGQSLPSLAEINQKGAEKKEQLEEVQSEMEELKEELGSLEQQKINTSEELDELEKRIERLKEEKEAYSEQEEYEDLMGELAIAEKKIEEAENEEPSEALQEHKQALAEVNQEIDEQNQAIARAKEYNRTHDRVEKLKAKEEQLAGQYEELEKQSRLLDKLVKAKVDRLESSINQKFELVNIKLFEPYSSKPGFKQTCEVTLKGVSADSTLNAGNMIKAGMDIVRTLSEHYGLKAPLWIDDYSLITEDPLNARAVPVPELETQTIKLQAKENVSKLAVGP